MHTLMVSPTLRAFITLNAAFELHWLKMEENNTSVGNPEVSFPRAFSKTHAAFGAFRKMCSPNVYFIN